MYKNILKALAKSDDKNITVLKQLHKKPNAESGDNMPTFQNFKANFSHQADLVHVPTSKFGYKYILVVVDAYSRHFEAEPLKLKSSDATLKGFENIYKRWPLPKRIEMDDGTEFKGAVKSYFQSHDVLIRYAMTNRHRQQGLVEARNSVIGKVIMMLLDLKEIETKKTSKDWFKSMEEFRKLIQLINDNIKYKPIDNATNLKITDANRNIFPTGTKVRVTIDYPIDIANEKRQYGKFRAGDIRWSKDIKVIEWNVLKPGQPPMYKVSGESVLRTIQQLQVVK
jgi:hypothetical protein